MARPNKIGLDYFPLDVDIFDDEKMVAISGEFGIKGEITVIKLLCAIYKNGYFVLWNDLFKFKLARTLPGMSPELIESIVYRLVLWGFFDKALFDSVEVLTSKGIQKRYFEASKRRKITRDLPYLLIDEVCGCEGDEALSSVDGLRNARSTVSGRGVNVYNNGVNVCNNSPLGDSETSSTYGKNPSASVNVCKNGVNVYNNSVNVDINTTKESKGNKRKKETPLKGSKEKPAPADFSPQAPVNNSRKDVAADAAGLPADPSNPPCPAGEETPPPGSAPPPSPRIDYIAIMNDFNARFAGKLPGVSRMTDSRRAAVRARIAECGPDSVTAVFDAIAASPFLCGANDRNWRADFDWVFKPRNYVKILENNYKNLKADGRKEQQKFGNTRPGDFAGKGYTDI